MERTVFSILACIGPLLLGAVLTAPPLVLASRPAESVKEPSPSEIEAKVKRLKEAPEAERRRATLELLELGPAALAETRRARDAEGDPSIRAVLDHAAQWLLAEKIKPILKERAETLLTFDGQFEDLKGEGPETTGALLKLFDDQETSLTIRMAAAHALADMNNPAVLPALRRMDEDPLLAFRLREEARTLMAILGDTSRLEKKIRELEEKAERKLKPIGERQGNIDLIRLIELYSQTYQENIDLSNLYYRIRKYGKAIECYERAVKILEDLRPLQRSSSQFNREFALTYYNMACSLSLNNEIDRAREMLRKAIKLDPMHLKNLEKDGDLRKLREAPGYEEFKRELEKPLEDKSI